MNLALAALGHPLMQARARAATRALYFGVRLLARCH